MRKLIVTTCFLIISSSNYADTCPTVNDLKTNKVAHWKAFDSDSGKPLPALREAHLKDQIKHFALAEWSNHTSMIHCYYKNDTGSHLEAYFAKERSTPAQPSKYWYEVTGMMQCAAGAEKCAFTLLPAMKQQLARNELR